MMTKLFWTVAFLDGVAALVLWRNFAHGPHGQGGGLLVLAYLVLVAGALLTTVAYPLLSSHGLRLAAVVVLLLLSGPLLLSSVATVFKAVLEGRRFDGRAYFRGPALDLAQALVKRDVTLVKQLIPTAGDLNLPQKAGTSLWQFGVLQADASDESLELLRVLLASGADPKRDTSADTLSHAIAQGARLTQFLLESGANPNLFDHQKHPVWWRTLQAGEDEGAHALLNLMLQHGADLTLRAPDGAGPIEYAIAQGYWLAACLLIEQGGEWKNEKIQGESVPELLEWEILRREEYPILVPDKLRKVLAEMKGEDFNVPSERVRTAVDIRIPDVLNDTQFENLEATRVVLSKLAQQPDWVRRVAAFYGENGGLRRNQVALLLSLKPDALSEDAQERCWTVIREQVAWYDQAASNSPKQQNGWLLRETAVIAIGLASIPGPVRERHRADFIGLRDRIEACRKSNDPDASQLQDLRKADWMGG